MVDRHVMGLAPCASRYLASVAADVSHGVQLKHSLMLRRLSKTLLCCSHRLDRVAPSTALAPC